MHVGVAFRVLLVKSNWYFDARLIPCIWCGHRTQRYYFGLVFLHLDAMTNTMHLVWFSERIAGKTWRRGRSPGFCNLWGPLVGYILLCGKTYTYICLHNYVCIYVTISHCLSLSLPSTRQCPFCKGLSCRCKELNHQRNPKQNPEPLQNQTQVLAIIPELSS